MRWLAVETWHLTLLFIGSADRRHVPAIKRLMSDVAAKCRPWSLSLEGAGGRGHGRDAVAWLTVTQGAHEIVSLSADLAQRFPHVTTRRHRPRRPPAPHMTVARRVDPETIELLRDQRLGRTGATWRADRLVLVRSHLGRDGARYETLHEARCRLPTDD